MDRVSAVLSHHTAAHPADAPPGAGAGRETPSRRFRRSEMNTENSRKSEAYKTWLATTSAADFSHWGLDHVAYIKPETIDGERVYAIHAADGQRIGVASGREEALVGVRHNDMDPYSVH
jgi:hypothetical protein